MVSSTRVLPQRATSPTPGGFWRALALFAALAPLLAGCNFLFFQPDARDYFSPHQFGLWHEPVTFPSADGTPLTGWFLPAQGKPRGLVIHFHGNAANISNHLYAVRWLPAAGYSVLMFDYRGFGASGGAPDRAGVIADGVAAIHYARSRKEAVPGRIIVYGQSLGGAVAVSALRRAGTEGIGALVLEGTFHSYREVVRLILSDSWLTWSFQYPVAYLLFSDDFRPLDDLPFLASVPTLVVHGEKDKTVSPVAGQALYAGVKAETKDFWTIPGAGHMGIFSPPGSPWRQRMVEWMDYQLGPIPPEGYRWQPRDKRWQPPPPHPKG